MASDLKSRLLTEFESFENKLNGESNSPLFQLRKESIIKFADTGFPTFKNEDWKYTNVSFLNKIDFHLSLKPKETNISIKDISPFIFSGLNENLLVFVNGHFNPGLSKIVSKQKNIKIGSLADAVKNQDNLAMLNLSQSMIFGQDSFSAINVALWQDGAYVYIPDDTIVNEPVHILQINDVREQPIMSIPRNLVIVGDRSSLSIIESAFNIGDFPGCTNSITEFYANNDSSISYYKIQNDKKNHYYLGNTHVVQHGKTNFNSFTISLDGIFTRNNLNSIFQAEHSESNFNGFYLIDGNNFVDNHTLADHSSPNCSSNENYKGIIDNSATAVFNGKIIVRPNAQKTTAYQSNKNILLSDDASINTKPQLEIFADDVKCSHGATSGHIDKDSMFYLLARGIGEETAKALLLYAFASEIIDKIKITELKENIRIQVAERLKLTEILSDYNFEKIV